MKRVNFNKISIRNLLSFGNDQVILDISKGLNVITGINRDKSERQNGVGKSALAEALYFGIFGTTMRELKKDLIPNTFTNGTCEVVIEFDVIGSSNKTSYKLVRTLNPSKLYLFENGNDITRDSIRNTEEYLHTVISASPSIFENCVILTLNNSTPFMAKSKTDKRKFIEGIFNLDIFSRMLNETRDQFNEKKRLCDIELTKMEDAQRSVNQLIKQKEQTNLSRKAKSEVYKQRKENNLSEKEKIKDELAKTTGESLDTIKQSVKDIKEGKDLLDKQISSLNEEKYTLATTIKHKEDIFKKIGTSEESCPVCLREMKDHDKNHIKQEKANIKAEIKTHTERIVELDDNITKLKKDKNQLDVLLEKYNKKLQIHAVNEQKKKTYKERLKQLDVWLSTLDADIAEMESEKNELDPLINENITHLEEVKANVDQYNYDKNLLDTIKFIVSEEGVKSYVVEKMLHLFNERIRYYLAKMDVNCICNFNQYFEEEIINENNKVCSYNNFSNGERKSIDMACLFAFIDMRRLQGDVTYSVIFLDEIMDTALDFKGTQNVLEILKDNIDKYNESVYIVTHKKELAQVLNANKIFLEKKDGITNIIDYNPFE